MEERGSVCANTSAVAMATARQTGTTCSSHVWWGSPGIVAEGLAGFGEFEGGGAGDLGFAAFAEEGDGLLLGGDGFVEIAGLGMGGGEDREDFRQHGFRQFANREPARCCSKLTKSASKSSRPPIPRRDGGKIGALFRCRRRRSLALRNRRHHALPHARRSRRTLRAVPGFSRQHSGLNKAGDRGAWEIPCRNQLGPVPKAFHEPRFSQKRNKTGLSHVGRVHQEWGPTDFFHGNPCSGGKAYVFLHDNAVKSEPIRRCERDPYGVTLRATRKPVTLLLSAGLPLLRHATRQSLALRFQPLPRTTRFEPEEDPRGSVCAPAA